MLFGDPFPESPFKPLAVNFKDIKEHQSNHESSEMHTDDSMRDYVSEQSIKGKSPKGSGNSFIT